MGNSLFIVDSQADLSGTSKEEDVHENMKFMKAMDISTSFWFRNLLKLEDIGYT